MITNRKINLEIGSINLKTRNWKDKKKIKRTCGSYEELVRIILEI